MTYNSLFPNPTIQEVVCEIIFNRGQPKLDSHILGDFYEQVKNEYPILEATPVQIMNVQVPSGQQSQNQPYISSFMRYRHLSNHRLVQISSDRMVVNGIGNYEGWEAFKDEIAKLWGKFYDIAQPITIYQVSLRYINRIERSEKNEKLSAWLNPTDYYSPLILNSEPDFLTQVHCKLTSTQILTVTLGDFPSTENSHGAFMFDIGTISIDEFSVDQAQLYKILDDLHENIWQIFIAAKGHKLDKMLKGEF